MLNFWVLLLGNFKFPGNNTQKFDKFQLLGNNTRKLTNRQRFWVNFRVTMPDIFNFQVMLLGNWEISRLQYPEIVQFSGIVTRKLLLKNTIFVNISAKSKIFWKIFKGVNLGSRYYGFMKNQTSKISCYCPFNVAAGYIWVWIF